MINCKQCNKKTNNLKFCSPSCSSKFHNKDRLTTWTEKDLEYLKENYHHKSNKTLAKELNRTVNAIRIRACRLKLIGKDASLRLCGEDAPNWKGYKDIPGRVYGSLQKQAAKRNIGCDISIEEIWDKYIQQERKCALTNLPIVFASYHSEIEQTASIDRINCLINNYKNNFQIVHKHINKMKLDHNQDYFIELCKLVAENNL